MSWKNALAVFLVSWLIVGLVIGLICGSIFAFELTAFELDAKLRGGQGGLIFGPVAGPVAGLIVGLLLGLIVGLVFGLSCGLIFGLNRGGSAVIKHYALRLILWRKGYTPFNLIKFLDHCAGLILLKKVGGSYIFIHRMLLDYFADLSTIEKSAESKRT